MARESKRTLIDRLFRAKHDYLPGTTIFRDVDVELIAEEMKLEALGERDGRAEVPSSTSNRATAAENEILGRFRSYWDEAVQGARAAHESYSTRAASLTSATDLETLVGEPHSIVSQLEQSARSRLDTLKASFEQHRDASRALESFKTREGLDRPPKQPKSFGVRILILVIAAAIELAINIGTFAAGDEFGLAGAALKVIAVPLLNIGGVFFLVFMIGRQITRQNVSAKVIGLAGLSLAFGWAFFLNLAVAHWRDSLGLAFSADAGKMALDRVLHATFELNDITSWVLFAAGFAAAILGAIDAFIWHDPHPGFTSHFNAKVSAAAAFEAERDDALYQLDEIADDAIARLKDALKRAETNASRRPELAQRAAALAEDLKVYEATLGAAAEDLVTRYREANQRARTSPSPERFDAPVALKLSKVSLPPIPPSINANEVDGLLSDAIRRIATARDEAADKLPTLSEWSRKEPTT
ncbi:hypothetical protein [Phenylobacterium sp.]|uniref:hypothetical protein n=1 Tax=Phenylobacterium sp. TaxID=1871053 RepID=UPI002737F45A|nr:hypothetical protein [Phenylobacterium sp.]MDP3870413.1 hypothetical protein [Phenylobacterium sp.]